MTQDLMKELQEFTEAPKLDGLGELSVAIRRMLEYSDEVETIEKQLAEAKARLQEVRVGKIPQLMAELGLSEVKTEMGHKVFIDTMVSCKFFPDFKPAALSWLEENNYGGLIKHNVSVVFGKDSEQEVSSVVNAIKAAGFEPTVDKGVHPMTLKAWATRQVEDGGEIPTNLFDFHTFSIAKVK